MSRKTISRKRTMQKQEFLKLFETAIRAAKSSARGERNSPEVARCVDAMNCLKEAPESLACDVILTTSIGQNLRVCIDHINPRIQSEANNLRNLWLSYLYATGRTKRRMISNGDSTRDKVIEILQTSLSKVANEVVETEMKKRVIACDPRIVAVSVEFAMFKILGCFAGPRKAKYRSILFNMGDSNNPDLRRKVLIGEINGDRLVTMERQEMASDKIQMEVQQHIEDRSDDYDLV